MIRRIDMRDAAVAQWAAIDLLMAQQVAEGSFQETTVVFDWSESGRTLDISPHQDGDELNRQAARANGHRTMRRLSVGGGVGFHVPGLPVVAFYYRRPYRKPDVTNLVESDRNGEANAAALRRCGLPGQYRSIGDVEIKIDDIVYKVLAGAALNYYGDLWMCCAALIWAPLSPQTFQAVGQAVHVPPEKFEDKQVKSLTARILPILDVAAQMNVSITLEELIDTIIEENTSVMLTGREVVGSDWSPLERDYVDSLVPFFEGEAWHNRLATSKLCQGMPADYQLGVAAYKSRKLIKASVIVDGHGVIQRALFTTDGFIRPYTTPWSDGLIGQLSKAVEGLRLSDEATLLGRISEVLARPDSEAPLIEPDHFLQPLLRAGQKLQPIGAAIG